MTPATSRETLIATIADLLEDVRHVAVGASSPIPAASAMLLRARQRVAGIRTVKLSLLGSAKHNFFTNGSAELFDCAGQGRVDAFFLGGGQIDGQGNINLVGAGAYPQSKVRWPGSFGSSYMYFVVPRVILFREEHTRRVFVEKVDFISAPGVSPEGVYRTGGPYALVTGLGLFMFDATKGRFRLVTVHPGHSVAEIEEATGFAFDIDPGLRETPTPDASCLKVLRGQVMSELAETYPDFAAQLRREIEPQCGAEVSLQPQELNRHVE